MQREQQAHAAAEGAAAADADAAAEDAAAAAEEAAKQLAAEAMAQEMAALRLENSQLAYAASLMEKTLEVGAAGWASAA